MPVNSAPGMRPLFSRTLAKSGKGLDGPTHQATGTLRS